MKGRKITGKKKELLMALAVEILRLRASLPTVPTWDDGGERSLADEIKSIPAHNRFVAVARAAPAATWGVIGLVAGGVRGVERRVGGAVGWS